MARLSEILHSVGEQIGDATRALWPYSWSTTTGIRRWNENSLGGLRFWPTTRPLNEGTEVNADFTRQLYRNEGENALGGGFAKPIVDLQVGFMGIPVASTDNEELNGWMNRCLSDFWVDGIQQMFRDTIRDSKCIVRMSKPDLLDPLMTIEEQEHCTIEVIPHERVDIERSASNKNIIERGLIRHRMLFVIDEGSPETGMDPTVEEHDVIEIIDRQKFRFWDQTTSKWIDSMGRPNSWGFVPLLEVYNEWDAALQGGQSDLETVIPFINAFHNVLTQALEAHRYHSTPKIKMKLADVGAFIKANFPEVWDDTTGTIKSGEAISWRGREIIFLQTEDDMGFVEAKSVLGDSKTLAEFLIDCICIASQTPEWAFMRVDSGSANSDRNAQTVPFVKKIDRKRRNYTTPIQSLLKMAQAIKGTIPYRPTISWVTIRSDDEVVEMQAFQQLVMGLEVAVERGEISDETYRRMIRHYLPVMKNATQEKTDAERDMKKRLDRIADQLPVMTGTPVVGGPQGKNE